MTGLTWHGESPVPAVVEALHVLYADFPVAPPEGLADFHLRVTPPRGLRRWWRPQGLFLTDGRSLFEPLPRAMAAPLLEWGLNRMIASRAHQYLILHAAAVERGGQALILPAPPGIGKEHALRRAHAPGLAPPLGRVRADPPRRRATGSAAEAGEPQGRLHTT